MLHSDPALWSLDAGAAAGCVAATGPCRVRFGVLALQGVLLQNAVAMYCPQPRFAIWGFPGVIVQTTLWSIRRWLENQKHPEFP